MLSLDYDIRGIFKKELTYEIIKKVTSEFLDYVKTKNTLLATDNNKRSIYIKNFILKNFPQVKFLGKLPTPVFYYEVIKTKTPGIIITASHLPLKYVGLKFLLKDGSSWKPNL